MMKRIFSKALLGALLALVSLQVSAWTSPVPLPDLEAARLRIVGQNARNYLSDFTASNADVTTEADFQAKTNKMANVFLALDIIIKTHIFYMSSDFLPNL